MRSPKESGPMLVGYVMELEHRKAEVGQTLIVSYSHKVAPVEPIVD